MRKPSQALLVSLALLACAFAQTAGQTGTQTAPQTATQPGTTPSAPNQPAGRAPIQAKSQAEFQAYQAAIASAQNPDAMEKAADDFATKFPDSQLRVLLYRAAMHSYQSAGNSGKMMEMGLKVLGIDTDDPEALIGVAEVQEEHTSPTDLDRDQRMTQALANAQHALDTVETDLAVPAGTPPDKLEAYKKYLRATSLEIVGTIQYKREQYADAETNLRKAIETDPSNPDPVVILRLALALDQQKKYPEALQQANRAVELTKEDTDVGKMARNERDRLMVQTGAGTPTPANAPSNTGGSSPAGAVPQSSPTPATEPPQNGAPPNH